MEIRQLEYFVAVVEEASFSAAARRCGVAQPSISEQIRVLEREVRQPLLDRLPRRVIPTAAGQQLMEHARRILHELSEAKRKTSELATGKISGRLTVGAIPTIAPFLLPRLVPQFEQRYPDVELLVSEDTTAHLLDAIGRGEIDVGITSSVVPTPQLHVETIGREPLVVMLPTRHPLAKAKRLAPAALDGERLVVLHEVHCLADQSAQFCVQRDLRPPVVMHGSNLFTLSAMVAIGMGISLVPQMMSRASSCAVRGVTYRPLATTAQPTRPLALVWSLLRYRPLAARAFAELATTALQAD